jgi:hypothetical protein
VGLPGVVGSPFARGSFIVQRRALQTVTRSPQLGVSPGQLRKKALTCLDAEQRRAHDFEARGSEFLPRQSVCAPCMLLPMQTQAPRVDPTSADNALA